MSEFQKAVLFGIVSQLILFVWFAIGIESRLDTLVQLLAKHVLNVDEEFRLTRELLAKAKPGEEKKG